MDTLIDDDQSGSDVAPTVLDQSGGDSDADVGDDTCDDSDASESGDVGYDNDVGDDGDVGDEDAVGDDGIFVDRLGVDEFTLAQISEEADIRASFLEGERLTCWNILQHCKQQVDAVRAAYGGSVSVFKIGITTVPVTRFRFYRHENMDSMTLIHSSESHELTNMLESALISAYSGVRGCRNINLGGEGNIHMRPPPYFTYVVAARADGRRRIGG
jgi:hypothetical protein